MEITTAQARVAQFVKEHHLETKVEARLLDLVSEVGELSKEALKSSTYGNDKFEVNGDWDAELADAFFSLIALANQTDVDMDKALEKALEKYRQRLENTGDSGSGQ